MIRNGAIARGKPVARRRLRSWMTVAACTLLAACGQMASGGPPGSLPRPALVAVGEFESAPDLVLLDPGFAARITRRMSGLTDYSIRRETARRAGATIRAQLVASLRAAGLPAEAGDVDNPRGDVVMLFVTGRLRSLDEAAMRQRKLPAIGAGRTRIVADIRVAHATDGVSSKTLATFEAEDNAGGGPLRAGQQTPSATATPGEEPLSPDVEAHMRRIAAATAERILAMAAEQGWTKGQTARAAR